MFEKTIFFKKVYFLTTIKLNVTQRNFTQLSL